MQRNLTASTVCATYAAEAVCRGDYLWDANHAIAAPAAATCEQLVTRLRAATSELQRAGEELSLLLTEQERCVVYMQRREAAISAALQKCQQRAEALRARSTVIPPCRSFGSQQPASGSDVEYNVELQYCEGLSLLLQDAWKAAAAVTASATMFVLHAVYGQSLNLYRQLVAIKPLSNRNHQSTGAGLVM